jgi:hypothetical protein
VGAALLVGIRAEAHNFLRVPGSKINTPAATRLQLKVEGERDTIHGQLSRHCQQIPLSMPDSGLDFRFFAIKAVKLLANG